MDPQSQTPPTPGQQPGSAAPSQPAEQTPPSQPAAGAPSGQPAKTGSKMSSKQMLIGLAVVVVVAVVLYMVL